MGLSLVLKQRLYIRLSFSLGEKSGDIPLFSLHRIKALVRKNPIGIGEELTEVLIQELLSQNSLYKKESGNDWNCLTGLNFTNALERVDVTIFENIQASKNVPDELRFSLEPLFAKLEEKRSESMGKIKNWFRENYDDLLYCMDGKIPWAVVRRLRRNLATWTIDAFNPFEEKIEDMVISVAQEQGIEFSSPEEAWEKMGGKVFQEE